MTCLFCLFTHGVVFHPLTVHIERHVGRVAPSTVGGETCIRSHVLVAQFDYLQNTGRGTGSDLYTVAAVRQFEAWSGLRVGIISGGRGLFTAL